jgi:glucose-1-phosphate cytidylyltransferase
MKVVLFCGGLGTRLREFTGEIPKPMVKIGYRPLMWHLMKYYAHYGHKDFILCLGYKADVIKNYFLNYNEYLTNDFTISNGGREIALASSDIQDWKITMVDTGVHANVGMRLRAIQQYVENEEYFLVNYSDGLSDCPLPVLIDTLKGSNKTGIFLSSRPGFTFHLVSASGDGIVTDIKDVSRSEIWVNAGFFVFRPSIFEVLGPGEELVQEPFQRLIEKKELLTHKHNGFFVGMDTFKEKQLLEDMHARGETPWAVWEPGPRRSLDRRRSVR